MPHCTQPSLFIAQMTSYTPPDSYTSQHRTRLRAGTCHHRTARRSPARARSTAPPSRISASRGRTAQG
ncbi:hypothetical protein AYI69_g9660 [Smittium culicis]|uniref:Uncharacterized protein n=1 Tax=Smittium culicis TaxID=133412 RepID=A0A1R1XB79_9FUNG|nr:hypothetical protein AYI69_g9660 [Smittium culicis]